VDKRKRGPKPLRIELEFAEPPQRGIAEWHRVEAAKLADRADLRVRATGLLGLKITAGAPEQARNIHDLVQPTIALLLESQVIEPSAHVVSVTACWDRLIPVGQARVQLWRTTAPQTRQSLKGRLNIAQAQSALWRARAA
jgi:hypothetical protein